jgi:hypothetical protein
MAWRIQYQTLRIQVSLMDVDGIQYHVLLGARNAFPLLEDPKRISGINAPPRDVLSGMNTPPRGSCVLYLRFTVLVLFFCRLQCHSQPLTL